MRRKKRNNNKVTPCNTVYKGTYGYMCYKEGCDHFGLWYCLNHKKYVCYGHLGKGCV